MNDAGVAFTYFHKDVYCNYKREMKRMTYITGDTHGYFHRYFEFTARMRPEPDDVMIILGDAALNYSGDEQDKDRKYFVNSFPFTTFCIHGNHEMRPWDVPGIKTKHFHGGTVWYEEAYPKLLYAKDGEIFDFDGYQCIVIGGAYSVDKYIRLARGYRWFENEQPSPEIKQYVQQQIHAAGDKMDIVFSHTCPFKYEPIETFIHGIDQSQVDSSTEEWLDTIEESLDYKKWYCGHFHTSKKTHKLQFMYEDIDILSINMNDK